MSAQTRMASMAKAVMEVFESGVRELAAGRGLDVKFMYDSTPSGYSADLVIAVRFTPKAAKPTFDDDANIDNNSWFGR